jgi:hypothetical protein
VRPHSGVLHLGRLLALPENIKQSRQGQDLTRVKHYSGVSLLDRLLALPEKITKADKARSLLE